MDWVEIITTFIIPAIFAIISFYVLPWIKEKNLYEYVKIAVYAAEQIFGSNTGKEKLNYVMNYVKQKFKISDEQLKNIIEAVVFEMNNTLKKEDNIVFKTINQ